MPQYKVILERHVEADSPEQAAHKAMVVLITTPPLPVVMELVTEEKFVGTIKVPFRRVDSDSRYGVQHVVTEHACSCEDFQFRGNPNCKHMARESG